MSNDPQTFHIGLDGFVWWVGVVESMDDPLAVGRCKVRIFGWHTKSVDELSTYELPWAFPLLPVTHANALPVYKPADWVVGFFLDGRLGQQPIIFGVLPSIPQADTP